jgi:prevent-host-death family protein
MVSAKGKLRSKVDIQTFIIGCGKLLPFHGQHYNNHIGHYGWPEGPMVREVNAVNFRQNLGEMLNQVQYRNDSVVISKDGKPVAALVNAELFARIRRMRDRFDELSRRIAEDFADVPEKEGIAEIDAAVARERSH